MSRLIRTVTPSNRTLHNSSPSGSTVCVYMQQGPFIQNNHVCFKRGVCLREVQERLKLQCLLACEKQPFPLALRRWGRFPRIPREMSSATKSEEKRLFSQAKCLHVAVENDCECTFRVPHTRSNCSYHVSYLSLKHLQLQNASGRHFFLRPTRGEWKSNIIQING